MALRNANSGQFEVYDIVNNQITTANSLGTIGLNFQVAGFGADRPANNAGDVGQFAQAMAGFAAAA
jgi:hypothetical protein